MKNKTISALIAASLALSPMIVLAQGASVGVDVSTEVQAGNANARAAAQTEAQAKVGGSAIAKAKERADKEITRRIANLNKLGARISAATHLSAEGKTNITAMVAAQVSDLQKLQAQIAGETSTTSLRVQIELITKSYHIYALVMPQLAITAAADRVVDVADAMNVLVGKIETRLAADVAAGATTSASVTAALTDMKAKIADAQTQANAAVNAIANLQPDNGDKTVMASNLAALKDARTKIQAGQQALVAARKELRTIMQSLKLNVAASATTTATTP